MFSCVKCILHKSQRIDISMKTNYILFFILLLAGLWSCSPEMNKGVTQRNLNQYKTYSWMEGIQKAENPLYNSEIIDANIKQAMNRELNARGFVADTQNPDVLIRYQTYTKEVVTSPGGYNMFPYAGWGSGYGMWGRTPVSYRSLQGTLVIDFIDAHTKEVVWRGHAEGHVDNPDRISIRVQKGVQSIMKKFPVKTGG